MAKIRCCVACLMLALRAIWLQQQLVWSSGTDQIVKKTHGKYSEKHFRLNSNAINWTTYIVSLNIYFFRDNRWRHCARRRAEMMHFFHVALLCWWQGLSWHACFHLLLHPHILRTSGAWSAAEHARFHIDESFAPGSGTHDKERIELVLWPHLKQSRKSQFAFWSSKD